MPTTLPDDSEVISFDLTMAGNMANYVWSVKGPSGIPEYFEEAAVPQQWVNATSLYIRKGDTVRVTITNPTKMVHPMHLHGHFFRVIQNGNWDAEYAPLKDTIVVRPNIPITIEFYADN